MNPEQRARAVQAGGSSSSQTIHGQAPLPIDSALSRALFPAEHNLDPIDEAAISGLRLDHFEILERIGIGGMGAVFRALDTRLQRTVALKILSPSQSRDLSAVQRFQNEAQAAARLDHDNIARVYYVGQDRGLQFIAFEFVVGANLRDLIRGSGRLEPEEAVNYTLQIASALRHTAAAGVVHRDIKPSNIIVGANGRAKLVDLGLARNVSQDAPGGELTMAGTTLGTFDYISPEQARDPRSVDVRSDIYSLGCTLYHMLTGEPPYPEGTVLQKLLDHQGGLPPDPAQKNRRVPPNLSAVVQRMMASDPRRRHATAEELLRDLMVVAASLGMRGASPEGLIWDVSRSRMSRFWERHLGWMVTASVLLLLVFALDRFPSLARRLSESSRATPGERSVPIPELAADSNDDLPNRPLRVGRGPLIGAGGTVAQNTRPLLSELGGGTAPPFPEPLSENGTHEPVPGGGSAPPVQRIGRADRSTQGTAPGTATGNPDHVSGGIGSIPQKVFGELPVISTQPSGDSPAPPSTSGEAGSTGVASGRPTELGATSDRSDDGSRAPDRTAADIASRPREADPGSNGARPPGDLVAGLVPRPLPGDTAGPSASAERPVKPPETRPPTDMRPLPLISIVSTTGGEPRGYPTLEAACAEAEDGSIIELRYDGPRPDPEKPLRIANRKITVRAARGFRPVVDFVLREAPTASGARMISVSNGALELSQIELRFTVENGLLQKDGEGWSLFGLTGAEQVRLQGVAITVLNPGSRSVAVFELAPAPGQTMASKMNKMKMMPGGMAVESPRFDVRLSECLVRGEADLMAVRLTQGGQLDLERSAIGIDGTLLAVWGGADMPAPEADLRLRLDHVTALVGNGLLRVDTGDLPRELVPVRVHARNNIVVARSIVPLVAMLGRTNAEDFRRLLLWNGERNFYDQFETFWSIQSSQGSTDFDRLDFDGWKRAWTALSDTADIGASRGPVAWKGRWSSRAARELIPSDFELDPLAVMGAVAGSTDGSDAGAELLRLPTPARN